jgi:hypothetical protein
MTNRRRAIVKILASAVITCVPLTLLILAITPAPTDYMAPDEFFELNEEGFAFHWSADSIIADRECELYQQCTWADIRTPACPGEFAISLEFYNKDGQLMTDGLDVIPARGRRSFNTIEVGTNRDLNFSTFSIVDASCYQGVPTGESEF